MANSLRGHSTFNGKHHSETGELGKRKKKKMKKQLTPTTPDAAYTDSLFPCWLVSLPQIDAKASLLSTTVLYHKVKSNRRISPNNYMLNKFLIGRGEKNVPL